MTHDVSKLPSEFSISAWGEHKDEVYLHRSSLYEIPHARFWISVASFFVYIWVSRHDATVVVDEEV